MPRTPIKSFAIWTSNRAHGRTQLPNAFDASANNKFLSIRRQRGGGSEDSEDGSDGGQNRERC